MRAFVLLNLRGDVDKPQYLKVYSLKFEEIWQKSRSYRTPANESLKIEVEQKSFETQLHSSFSSLAIFLKLSKTVCHSLVEFFVEKTRATNCKLFGKSNN